MTEAQRRRERQKSQPASNSRLRLHGSAARQRRGSPSKKPQCHTAVGPDHQRGIGRRLEAFGRTPSQKSTLAMASFGSESRSDRRIEPESPMPVQQLDVHGEIAAVRTAISTA